MDYIKVLKDVPVGDIQNYLVNDCNQEFETSQLYSSKREEKFTDEDLRKSVFRPITDTKLFDLVDSIVSTVNKNDPSYIYTLHRNDITHIKYDKGGFFKRHRDYLSTTSNLLEEFTLLLCVTPDDIPLKDIEGGDTIIYTYGRAKIFNTTSTGCGILFRKDLEHAAMELKHGEKHIITANVWGMRKELSKQVLLVTFPEESNMNVSLEDAANASTSYAIPVDVLSGMLLTHVQWTNRRFEQEGKTAPPFVTYKCRDFSFNAFGVVEKILNRSYVTEDAINAAKDCLDFFGPFKTENILVNLAIAQGEPKSSDTKSFDRESTLTELRGLKVKELKVKLSEANVCYDQMTEKEELVQAACNAMEGQMMESISEHTSKKARTSKSEDVPFDTDLIICESEARMRAVASVASVLGEQDYVTFKMLLVEGVMMASGEDGYNHAIDVPMQTAACLIGDYDNVFSLRKICSQLDASAKPLHYIHMSWNLFDRLPKTVLDTLKSMPAGKAVDLLGDMLPSCDYSVQKYIEAAWRGSGEDKYELGRELRENGYGLSLKLGLQSQHGIKSSVMRSCLHEPYKMTDIDARTIYLPGLDEHGKGGKDSTSLFHRNEKGEVVFSNEEAERASDFIASFALEEKVKASLQQKRFVLPQQTEEVTAHFCNESVYGNVNILWVCGVMRMRADYSTSSKTTPKSATTTVFDAWPSEEAIARTTREKRHIIRNAIQDWAM